MPNQQFMTLCADVCQGVYAELRPAQKTERHSTPTLAVKCHNKDKSLFTAASSPKLNKPATLLATHLPAHHSGLFSVNLVHVVVNHLVELSGKCKLFLLTN